MDKKLIFLDIDGTLTAPGENIPPASAIDAIAKARKNGHKIFLCTGRNYAMLSPLLAYDFDGVIGSSGGYVEVEGKQIYDKSLTTEQREYIMKTLKDLGMFCTIEGKNGSYTDEGFKDFLEQHASEGSNSELLRWRRQIETNLSIQPLSAYTGEPVYKVIFMSVSAEAAKKASEILAKDFSLAVQEPDQFGITNGEIVAKGLDKGAAVHKVAEYLGVDMKDTVGFGDSMNDREMMEETALSICMANGSEGLKAISDEITDAVTEDGMYKAFEKHGWI